MPEEKLVSVTRLWDRLHEMEEEKRFDGRSYPFGMSCFPFKLTGQGFFPGGDGLWREDALISKSSSGFVATKGIMFLGNDFGTCKSYERLRKKGFENPLTWKHVKQRILRAELPLSHTFFTNAVMGLRNEGTALEKKDWDKFPMFKDFCREFLIYQVETIRPKLIVVMGPVPKATLGSLSITEAITPERFPAFKIGSNVSTIYYCTHPYGDFNFDEARKVRDGLELRDAWTRANLN
jgi:hypothetical protein